MDEQQEQQESLKALEELFRTDRVPVDDSKTVYVPTVNVDTGRTVLVDKKPAEPEQIEKPKPAAVPVQEKPKPENETAEPVTADKKRKKALFIDADGEETPNYTGDEVSERDYRPVRQSHEYHSGCLGGVMYFVFVTCLAIIIAVFAWMAASDMLALNKESFTVEITLPSTIFRTETVESVEVDGKVTQKEITYADIDYVAETLQSAGIIEYRWLFSFFCDISNADRKLDAGTYTLKSSFDYRAIVSHMQTDSNRTMTVKVTIPEGYSMYDIFLKLEEAGVCSFDDLMEAAANYAYKYAFLNEDSLGNASRLEGYLFPDTYEFYVGMQASSAINKFLRNFNDKMTKEIRDQIEAKNLTLSEVVTMASLIEKEAAVDAEQGVDERRTVSSVIYNRIKAGMSLGLESAILYIYPDYEGMPTAEMMQTDSPYNLNLYTGLPPTPICNPSIAAIEAVLNPESTKYYYFTLDNTTGTHRFFRHYNDFLTFLAEQDANS